MTGRRQYAPRSAMTVDGLAIFALLRVEIVRVGWSETARRCGIDRTALHRAFRDKPATRSPHFGTIMAVADALGLEFTVRRRAQ